MSNTNNNSYSVKEFTEGASGKPCPNRPIVMDREAVRFIIRMVMSELDETAATVCSNQEEKRAFMAECLESIDSCKQVSGDFKEDRDRIAAQADSMVDAWYYMLNTACKHGMNLSALFEVVHAANMAKRDPETGQFIRRESDGKVVKPEGWQPPNVEGEVDRWIQDGSW